jgi:glutathione S-transferase
MKLYYSPGACSLSDHIALLETREVFEAEAVDIHTKRTASGSDFLAINPKGYVPALVLDDGQVITENVAVLDWIADQFPRLRPAGVLGRTRLIEMLAFIASEIHPAFKPLWHAGTEADKEAARERIAKLLSLAATHLSGDYLFDDEISTADCYLFVMLRWAEKFGVAIPEPLLRLQWRMEQRPAVQAAIGVEEGALPRHREREIRSQVSENPEHHRFERPIHENALAAAYYRDADGKLAFIHTEVPAEFTGQGIATELARGALDIVRVSGRKAILICPFMTSFYVKHPEYSDVVVG